MNKRFFFLLLFTGLFSCTVPTELFVPDNAKTADSFSRAFIDKVINGQIESSFADVDTEVRNDEAKEFLTNSSNNINGAIPKKYRVVEVNYTKTSQYINYKLGYEYEFEEGNILFSTTIKEKDGRFTVLTFNGEFLPAPLSELTKFTLSDKSAIHYIFLVLCILVPLFILTTFIVMLFTKMTVKKKISWALLILLITFSSFVINWGSGQFDFKLLNIRLLGSSFYKPTIYSAWLLSFNIPIGAIVFWIKRKSLMKRQSNAK